MSQSNNYEGTYVDLTPWAYVYKKNAPDNPCETQWLWANKSLMRDGPIWSFQDVNLLKRLCPKEKVLCAFMWEEMREICHVELEFSYEDGQILDIDKLMIVFSTNGSMWECTSVNEFFCMDQVANIEKNTSVFRFAHRSSLYTFETTYETLQKLFVVYIGEELISIPTVRVYGAAKWEKALHIEVEWGFQAGRFTDRCNGRIEIYNGFLDGIQPLDEMNHVQVLDNHSWKEGDVSAKRRGIRIKLRHTDATNASKTIVTLWTSQGNMSFAIPDLLQDQILVPSIGIFIVKETDNMTAQQFLVQVAACGEKTTRERVRVHAEHSLAEAMKVFNQGRTVFPQFPEPPIEPIMKIDVPDQQINAQWKVGAWHLTKLNIYIDEETICPSIFPPDSGKNYAGALSALGQESYQMVRTLDLMGMHDLAEYCLNYWLFGEHAQPFIWFSEEMGDGAFTNPYSNPNQISPGYDQKHSGGHGRILETAAFHYQLTRNQEWYHKAQSVFEKACMAIVNVRKAFMKQVPEGSWVYGLLPPGCISDIGDIRLFYFLSLTWYSGLMHMANVLEENGSPICAELVKEAKQCIEDIRKSTDKTAALNPVIKVNDNTYRRYVSRQPYLRDILDSWHESVIGGTILVPTIYPIEEPLAQDFMDVLEDVVLPQVPQEWVRELRPKLRETDKDAWFTGFGHGSHGMYENHHLIHLLSDDIPLYIRSVFNSYAATVDPDREYMFWEMPFKVAAHEKPCEEAAFLEHIRMMLVMEDGSNLWLAKATPRAWLEQGKKISVSQSPTLFGSIDYTITSDVIHNLIHAEINPPKRIVPETIYLRLRHPEGRAIKKVVVNEKEWGDFDVHKELVLISGHNFDRIDVTVYY